MQKNLFIHNRKAVLEKLKSTAYEQKREFEHTYKLDCT